MQPNLEHGAYAAHVWMKVHLMDPRDPTAAPVCVAPRQEGIEYFVEHCAALPGGSTADVNSDGGPAAAGSSHSGSGSTATSGSGDSTLRSPTLVLLTSYGSDSGEMRLMTAAAGTPARYTRPALNVAS